jgi:hypothetical protein
MKYIASKDAKVKTTCGNNFLRPVLLMNSSSNHPSIFSLNQPFKYCIVQSTFRLNQSATQYNIIFQLGSLMM